MGRRLCTTAIQPFTSAYLHASNAARSGSTQEGADDTFLWLDPTNGTVQTWFAGTGGGTSGFGSGNDVNSDGNVQVFGAAVPEPATIIIWSLLGGLGLVFAWRKRKAA